MSSTRTESAFMAALLADLDASIFSEELSPPPRRHSALHSSQGKGGAANSRRSSQSHVQISLSPSQSRGTGKKPFKRVRSETKVEIQPPRSSVYPNVANTYKAEMEAATELVLQSGNDWASDMLSPPPKHQKRVHSQGNRESAQFSEKPNTPILKPEQAAEERTACSRYTRCTVDEVTQSQYTPLRYCSTSTSKYTTKGVLPKTVASVTQRKQVILHVSVLTKIESTSSSRKPDLSQQGEGQRRVVLLRDEWLNMPVHQGDVIHLVGQWSDETSRQTRSSHVDVISDEDDPDWALWNDVADMPSLSPPKTEKIMIPTMTLASSAQSIDSTQGHLDASITDNLLILHPDVLLSATAVSTVIRCTRKAYLQSKIKASGPSGEDAPSESLLMGKMLHEVLQGCLTGRQPDMGAVSESCPSTMTEQSDLGPFPTQWTGPAPTNFSAAFVREQIENQVRMGAEDILGAGLDSATAMDKLWEAAAPFGLFASRYLVADKDGKPKEGAVAQDARSNTAPLLRITKVLDVEEDIWSPMYGLKGFVDVSVEAEMVQQKGKADSLAVTTVEVPTKLIMPLELKTGRSVDMVQHQAQTMLYTLMMSDRYDIAVNTGLLYYSKTSTLHLIHSVRNEIRGLILARNDLASYLMRQSGRVQDRTVLPPSIENERDCSRCYVADDCMLYRRALDERNIKAEEGAESATQAIYQSKVGHLTQRHADFFQHWERLLSLEEEDIVRFRRQLWTMTASAREATGRCFAGMSLLTAPMTLSVDYAGNRRDDPSRLASGMNKRVIYHFGKIDHSPLTLTSSMATGDPISVSIEPDKYSVAQGHLLSLTPTTVTVAIDRDLPSIVERLNVKYAVFRIDKEEFANGMARVRYNLAKLFFPEPQGDPRRRELIVDLKPPRFSTDDSDLDAPKRSGMNADQEAAIAKVLSARDYALIVGMPGTGKTTTIVELIRTLVGQGKTILLTSYTHSAVDTLCRKLGRVSEIQLLRLGTTDRIHTDVHPYTLKPADSMEELRSQLITPNVVATTCLSISHTLFAQRKFDYCIVDEASQITLPTCLGPLRYADRFVLVGDSLQLPPLVKNNLAKEGGLDVSLFDLLQRKHPHSVAQLRVQYRMNEDIMKLSNTLVYGGELRCGNEDVRRGVLNLPQLDAVRDLLHLSGDKHGCWIEKVLDSQFKALFINTDEIRGEEHRVGETLLENETEAEIVMQACAALVSAGVPLGEIGIITPYRQQLRALVKRLGNACAGDKIEVLTADKSQGRDKDVIVISFVRSNGRAGAVGEDDDDDDDDTAAGSGVGQLLSDVKRINVSLTRARKKLIIVGSRSTLSKSKILGKLWDLMDKERWTMNLTTDQLQEHQARLASAWDPYRLASTSPAPHAKKSRNNHNDNNSNSNRVKQTSFSALQHRPILQDVMNEVM